MPPHPFDEDEAFGEPGLPVVPYSALAPVPRASEEVPVKQQFNRPMQAQGAPPGWRCNARRVHEGAKEESETCHCSSCLQRRHDLVEGPPWSNHSSFPTKRLVKDGYIGLYDPREKEITVGCAVCQEPITIDGRTADRFDEEVEEVVHVACLESGREELEKIGYRLPYLIRCRRNDAEPECSGEDLGGDGDGGA